MIYFLNHTVLIFLSLTEIDLREDTIKLISLNSAQLYLYFESNSTRVYPDPLRKWQPV